MTLSLLARCVLACMVSSNYGMLACMDACTPEHDDLVLALPLVPRDQKSTSQELGGVHDVQQLLARTVLRLQVLPACKRMQAHAS